MKRDGAGRSVHPPVRVAVAGAGEVADRLARLLADAGHGGLRPRDEEDAAVWRAVDVVLAVAESGAAELAERLLAPAGAAAPGGGRRGSRPRRLAGGSSGRRRLCAPAGARG